MNKNNSHNTTLPHEFLILVAVLGIVYSIFVITAFAKLKYFWGINFLYYQPLSIKLLFIVLSGAAFVPSLNNVMFGCYLRIADAASRIQRFSQGKYLRLIYLLCSAALFAGLFYYFRVVSLYHAPMGAVYFMQRDVPIMEYYKEWYLINDKYTLLLFWAAWRYIFHGILHLPPYWVLAAANILCGILFMICLDFFLRKLSLKPLQQFLVFILIFTQAITYFFFGFANYYGPIPVVIFLYLLAVVTYFRNAGSVFYPLAFGVVAILTHFGALFIAPSMLYLLIHKYRDRLSGFNNLFNFNAPLKSSVFFGTILIVSYVLLNIIKLGHIDLQEFTVPPFAVTKRYGFPLFSSEYVIHLFNTLLLNSPIGIVLFLIFAKDIRSLTAYNEFNYTLLWVAIGGLIHNILLLPQTIFAWDGFAWASPGYVIAGALLFLNFAERIKHSAYITALITTHALVYFAAWISLNNNTYASVLNYLDTAETFDPQFAWCMQIIRKDPRDRANITKLLHQMESRAQTKDDYYELGTNYYTLAHDAESSQRIFNIYSEYIEREITKNPENAWNYYNYYTFLELPVIEKTQEIDSLIEYSYKKTVEIEPNNTHYCLLYAGYLLDKQNYQAAFPLLLRSDSLYSTQGYSELRTNFSHAYIKCKLSYASYLSGDIPGTISYFNEAENFGLDAKESVLYLAFECCMNAYAALGNKAYAKLMLKDAHQRGLLKNADTTIFTDDLIKDNCLKLNISYDNSKNFTSGLLTKVLNEGNTDAFKQLLTYMTVKNDDADFALFRCLLYLIQNEPQKLIGAAVANTESDDSAFDRDLFSGVAFLQEQKYDSALADFQKSVSLHPQTQALWLIPYTMLLQGNDPGAQEWIQKYEKNASISANIKNALKFTRLLSSIARERNLTSLLTELKLIQNSHQSSSANYFMPHLEQLLQKYSLQENDKRVILECASALNIGIIKDLIER